MRTVLTLALLAVPFAANAQEPLATLDAGAESRALAAHLESDYAEFLTEYIHVFLGYVTCQYDFIEEDVLNSLADDTLKDMSRAGAEMIRAQHAEVSPDVAAYAATMAVLTSVEMWSNAITAEMAPEYEAEGICAASAAPNRQRYEDLQAARAR